MSDMDIVRRAHDYVSKAPDTPADQLLCEMAIEIERLREALTDIVEAKQDSLGQHEAIAAARKLLWPRT